MQCITYGHVRINKQSSVQLGKYIVRTASRSRGEPTWKAHSTYRKAEQSRTDASKQAVELRPSQTTTKVRGITAHAINSRLSLHMRGVGRLRPP